jgi:hypothetical protein
MATLRPPDPNAVDQHVIEELADELHCESDLVAEIYLHEADGLAQTARVPDFISVFAARRTRERLRRGR